MIRLHVYLITRNQSEGEEKAKRKRLKYEFQHRK
jgi:hypothetical protein